MCDKQHTGVPCPADLQADFFTCGEQLLCLLQAVPGLSALSDKHLHGALIQQKLYPQRFRHALAQRPLQTIDCRLFLSFQQITEREHVLRIEQIFHTLLLQTLPGLPRIELIIEKGNKLILHLQTQARRCDEDPQHDERHFFQDEQDGQGHLSGGCEFKSQKADHKHHCQQEKERPLTAQQTVNHDMRPLSFPPADTLPDGQHPEADMRSALRTAISPGLVLSASWSGCR